MSNSCGIVGLPNVGKSTLFKILSGNPDVKNENYPFCTIEPNVGMAAVPDTRLAVLYDLFKPKKAPVYQYIKIVDIAGLVKGASEGAGLGNTFLSHIRGVDVLIHVVRDFINDDVIHVDGVIDPISDVETIEAELALSDIEQIAGLLDKKKKLPVDKKLILEQIYNNLNAGIAIWKQNLSETALKLLKEYSLLSAKPMLYVLNVDDRIIGDALALAKKQELFLSRIGYPRAMCVPISMELEEEISYLDNDSKQDVLTAFGLTEMAINRLLKAAFHLLGYITFFTVGDDEVRAWTINYGDTAVIAASKIHTDFLKGFVRAEVISYQDMIKYKTVAQARKMGALRIEGRDYIVQDGDILNILSNV